MRDEMRFGAVDRKAAVVRAARYIYALRYGAEIAEAGGCLFWAAAFVEAAAQYGLDAIIQAGSAEFQFRSDDNVRDTHFSYVFEPLPAILKFQSGELPEMHVWNYVRTTKEIVDLTTRFQPQQARDLQGYAWSDEFVMPDYLWTPVSEIQSQSRFVYTANISAIKMSLQFLHAFELTQREEAIAEGGGL